MALSWRGTLGVLADLFFPPLCVLCEAPLGGERPEVCFACRDSFRTLRPGGCARCGSPAPASRLPCRLCRGWLELQGARSAYLFTGAVRGWIHAVKYGALTGLVPLAGAPLERCLGDAVSTWGAPAALVPVPLHAARRRERGFNQAELLAGELAGRCGVPVVPVLARARPTRAQVELDAGKRRANVAGAFRVRPELEAFCRGRTLALVDDVLTTGSTLEACAAALHDGGAERVFAVTLARAVPTGAAPPVEASGAKAYHCTLF
ncbi:MAG: ComF family protein [Gemmatimonadota bacterium]